MAALAHGRYRQAGAMRAIRGVLGNWRPAGLAAARLALLGLFVFLVAGFTAAEYGTVRETVRFICTSCTGLGG